MLTAALLSPPPSPSTAALLRRSPTPPSAAVLPRLSRTLSPSPLLNSISFAPVLFGDKTRFRFSSGVVNASPYAVPVPPAGDESEKAKLVQVSKRLEKTSRYFKRLGSFGFWAQLVCTIVSAVILSFSAIVTGRISSPATFYATSAGIVAAFVSVFWSFGYIRLSERLRRTASEPAKAPPRAEVVKSLKNGIGINLIGMGAAILGMQATVGLLVAKALTTSTSPFYQGIPPGQSPVIALDVFLVQASANTILSHFLGILFSLELLRSVTIPQADVVPIPVPT